MSFLSLVETWANALWNPWLLGAFLLVGGWYTLRSGLFQLTPHRWLGTLKRSLRRPSTGGLTQAQALSTAPGLYHRHRLHRWSGHRHFLRRARRGVLDVGLCPAGNDDRVCGKIPRRRLPGARP